MKFGPGPGWQIWCSTKLIVDHPSRSRTVIVGIGNQVCILLFGLFHIFQHFHKPESSFERGHLYIISVTCVHTNQLVLLDRGGDVRPMQRCIGPAGAGPSQALSQILSQILSQLQKRRRILADADDDLAEYGRSLQVARRLVGLPPLSADRA